MRASWLIVFVLVVGVDANAKPKQTCSRTIAAHIARDELRVVGVVRQGKQPRLVLTDRRERLHVVAPGQCAGRERVPFSDWLAVTRTLIAD